MSEEHCQMMADISRWAVENLIYIEFVKGMAAGMEVAAKCILEHGSDASLMKQLIDEQKNKATALKAEHHRRFQTPEGIAATQEQWREAWRKSQERD